MTGLKRRDLLAAAGLAGAPMLAAADKKHITLVLDPADPVAASAPAGIAARALQAALRTAGYAVVMAARPGRGLSIRGTGPGANERRMAESFTVRRAGSLVTVTGADARGLSYGLYALAERLHDHPGLDIAAPFGDTPVNPVRSVMRQFTSEAYDKPWFYDRPQWTAYLAMLAQNRFNRLHLAFGLAYDQLGKVRDSYFLFTYPFLLDVPGYKVRVSGLSDAERERNLDTLRFVSEQCVAHGLDFQLGLWMHGYDWPSVPGVAMIEGLTADTHAAYCRDALALLLEKLPAVSSVGLRIHGESGVKEGSYDFWKAVFTGVAGAGRPVEIDLHAKGIDQTMIDNALATGMPLNLAPKYWGEHWGMPYHQAAIRANEMPAPGQVGRGLMTLSEGARSFTRYGYADLLRDDRKYTVRHRIFPGTQRILASRTDPAYGAQFTFCGSTGADVMEPLTYRGRRGSATKTPRSGYAAPKMVTPWDWQKYDAWYAGVGRALYNPKTAPAPKTALDEAMAAAGRILPLVTTAYAPSAACDAYWPEVYWNQPLAAEPSPNPYRDDLAPRVFDNATPLDPQLFSTGRAHAAALLGTADGKVSPVQVATWLEDYATATEAALARAGKPRSVDAARLTTDIAIQAALGRFFAAKFRAGVLFALHGRTQDRRPLAACVVQYEKARGHWAAIVALADGVYGDLSSSDTLTENGAWADRLALIDADLGAVKAMLAGAQPGTDAKVAAAIAAALARPTYRPAALTHTAPSGFTPGAAVELGFAGQASAMKLWYRHVNQGEPWQSVAATAQGGTWRAEIPAAYTASPWPLQYYAEVWNGEGAAPYPGFPDRPGPQPYIVLHRMG